MKLTKLIKQNNTSPEYLPFVNNFTSDIINSFSSRVHSIYICGSIPKGKAVPYSSDADFTLIFKKPLSEKDFKSIEEIKSSLLSKYPFIVKIDTPTITVEEVMSNPYDWGFWISIISLCIYGDDLSKELPSMIPNRKLVTGINSDTIETINKFRTDLSNISDTENLLRTQQKLARRLIIALFTLVLPEVQIWPEDISDMKDGVIKHFPEKEAVLEYLYTCTNQNKIDNDELLIESREAQVFFERNFQSWQTNDGKNNYN